MVRNRPTPPPKKKPESCEEFLQIPYISGEISPKDTDSDRAYVLGM